MRLVPVACLRYLPCPSVPLFAQLAEETTAICSIRHRGSRRAELIERGKIPTGARKVVSERAGVSGEVGRDVRGARQGTVPVIDDEEHVRMATARLFVGDGLRDAFDPMFTV